MGFHLAANNIITWTIHFTPGIECVTLLYSFVERCLCYALRCHEWISVMALHPNSHKIRWRYSTVGRSRLTHTHTHTQRNNDKRKGERNEIKWRMLFCNKIHIFIVHMPRRVGIGFDCVLPSTSNTAHIAATSRGSCRMNSHSQWFRSHCTTREYYTKSFTETIVCIRDQMACSGLFSSIPRAPYSAQAFPHRACWPWCWGGGGDYCHSMHQQFVFSRIIKIARRQRATRQREHGSESKSHRSDAYSTMSWIYCLVHVPSFCHAHFWYLNRESSQRTTPIDDDDDDDIISFMEFHFNSCDRFQYFQITRVRATIAATFVTMLCLRLCHCNV